MKKSIILSAGHSNTPGRDQGATGNGYIEGQLTVEFRQLVAIYLKKMGIDPIMDGNNTVLIESLNYFRKKISSSNTISVEFHWNSASSTASGTEVLVPAVPTTEESNLASDLAKITASLLSISNRGVKTELQSHHGNLGWMTLPGTTILMEICFISNSIDMELYQENKMKLAESVAKILFNYANGLSSLSNISATSSFKFYEVKSGDNLTHIATLFNTTVNQIMFDNLLKNPDEIHIGQKLKIKN